MKLPLDFYNFTKLKGYVNFFSSCSIAPPNKLFLGCKPLSFALKKKTMSCQKWLPGGVLPKKFSENFAKFTGCRNTRATASFQYYCWPLGTPAQAFCCEFYEILRKSFWQNTSGWLLLVFTLSFVKNIFFIEHLLESAYFMFKLEYFSRHIQ